MQNAEIKFPHYKIEKKEFQNRMIKEEAVDQIIGRSPAIEEVKRLIRAVADSHAPILITGESGTGKELVAHAIHCGSSRSNKPFVVLNAGAIPNGLLESELFGYERGAFTGATRTKLGKLELSKGGTIFLDEIGDMPLSLQAKILRAIENHEIERLGGTKLISLDFRLVAATNKDLHQLVEKKKFREDLYYRLNVINISLPALRDRRQDIPLLAYYFLKKYAKEEHKNIISISLQAFEVLETYNWPGNIREIENVIERAVILCDGQTIEVDHLPKEITSLEDSKFCTSKSYNDIVKDFKKLLILRTLQDTNYNKTEAAKRLGLNRTYLFKLLKSFDIK